MLSRSALGAALLVSLVSLAGVGCETEPAEDTDKPLPALEAAPTTYLTAVDSLGFGRAVEGVASGFNVDGKVSKSGEVTSCGKGDFTAPWGTTGIDNQFANLMPLIELSGLGALEGIVESILKDGGLLIMVQMDGLDDFKNDDDVKLTIRLGQGTPLLGTDGRVLAGQTFELNPASPETSAKAKVVDGVLTTEVFDTKLPVVVFGVNYQLEIKKAQVRATITEDGGLVDGVLGGGVPVDSVREIAKKAEEGQSGLYDLINTIIGTAGDLEYNAKTEECEQISAALEFTAVSAFLFK